MQEVQGTPAAAVLPAKRALELEGGCEMLEAEPARGGCRPASPPGGPATEAGGAVPPSGDAGTEAEVPADMPQPAKPKLQEFKSRSFYPANRLAQVEQRILRFLANVQARLRSEPASAGCWEVFPLQQPAFDYADQRNAEEGGSRLRVFSVEMGAQGRRRFLVTSYPQLWRRYRDMLPQHRHFYEIVRQGWPCHLYFDLEFQRAENPGADGGDAVDALLALLGELLREKFGLGWEPSWALELDSSTEAKFSRHLIVRLPGAAFASTAHAGALVRELCCHAAERQAADPSCPEAHLFVNKGGERVPFIDLGVYTRNRAFRLYLSSKLGKDAILQCTGRFGGGLLSQEEVFQRGLICDVDPAAALLRCFDETTAGAAGAAGPTTVGAALQRLGVGLGGGGGQHQVQYGPSPYPALEEFVASICSKQGGASGTVRSWVLLDSGSLLLLNVRGNRWCSNVGREHKSNGVFYVVDLQAGVWCQRCYDPDCRSYRSPLTALPEHLAALYEPQQQQQQQQTVQESPVKERTPLVGGPSAAASVGREALQAREKDPLGTAQAVQPEGGWFGVPLSARAAPLESGSSADPLSGQQQGLRHWDQQAGIPGLRIGQSACAAEGCADWGASSRGWGQGEMDSACWASDSDDLTDEVLLEALAQIESQRGGREHRGCSAGDGGSDGRDRAAHNPLHCNPLNFL